MNENTVNTEEIVVEDLESETTDLVSTDCADDELEVYDADETEGSSVVGTILGIGFMAAAGAGIAYVVKNKDKIKAKRAARKKEKLEKKKEKIEEAVNECESIINELTIEEVETEEA